MQSFVELIQFWVHEVVAANVEQWDKVAVRVNPLFVASATRYVWVFRVAQFCRSEKQYTLWF